MIGGRYKMHVNLCQVYSEFIRKIVVDNHPGLFQCTICHYKTSRPKSTLYTHIKKQHLIGKEIIENKYQVKSDITKENKLKKSDFTIKTEPDIPPTFSPNSPGYNKYLPENKDNNGKKKKSKKDMYHKILEKNPSWF